MGLLAGTIKRAKALRKQRDAAQRSKTCRTPSVWTDTTLVPLGPVHADELATAAKKKYPRRKNWESPAADHSSRRMYVSDINNGRYSSRCTYAHWTYEPRIRSCGRVTERRLLYFHANSHRMLIAPRGWKFGLDRNGIYISRVRERREFRRYHPTSDDLANVTTLRAAAIAHERKQIDATAAERFAQKMAEQSESATALVEQLGWMVSADDSVQSGNCEAGTIGWIRRNGLRRKWYDADKIMRLDDSMHVRRAVARAKKRTIEDVVRGYCKVK
jgi:hypothetical protein